ncbi:hypothetical protein D3H65_21850 [Paraflavitalea soli]|uniref:Uncharacterized protein n=1 Tax=Paraflavitalea soli TaxID=2315862 RepID=A0A3B7MQQ8_9BACT|nr:hypothetical protein D3H65_21850 [Paraflavitalea soli]
MLRASSSPRVAFLTIAVSMCAIFSNAVLIIRGKGCKKVGKVREIFFSGTRYEGGESGRREAGKTERQNSRELMVGRRVSDLEFQVWGCCRDLGFAYLEGVAVWAGVGVSDGYGE